MLSDYFSNILSPELFWKVLKCHPPTAKIQSDLEQINDYIIQEFLGVLEQTLFSLKQDAHLWLQELLEQADLFCTPHQLVNSRSTRHQSIKSVHQFILQHQAVLNQLCTWAIIRLVHRTSGKINPEYLPAHIRLLLTTTLSSIDWNHHLHIGYLNHFQALVERTEAIANAEFNGEISLIKLRDGWKVAFGQPRLDEKIGKQQIAQLPTFSSCYSGLEWLAGNKLSFESFPKRNGSECKD